MNKASELVGVWNYPTEIHFAPGELQKLPTHCLSHQITKPLIVTDAVLAELDIFKNWLSSLDQQGFQYAVFKDVKPNPTGTNVRQGVKQLNQEVCNGVIAIGGGSALDAGKAMALMAGQSLDLFEFEDVGNNWQKVIVEGILPCIAIPTTAGTGSEVGRASVILDEQHQIKKIIFHPLMMPGLVIADPELTFGLPAKLTAATGLDAFVHCFEAFCAPGFHPMADGIAVEGMRLIWKWLEVAYHDPKNLQARSNMLVASSMGATAFQKGLGAVHALAHPLGALYDAHHGLLNAILLPYVIKANLPKITDKLAYLSRILDLPDQSTNGFIDSLLAWRKALGIPDCLQEINIDDQQLDLIATMAVEDPSSGGNPIQFQAMEYASILKSAIEGRL